MTWRKSRFSANGGNCVEVGWPERGVAVRDSKNAGPVIAFPGAGWREFIANLQR
jgi:hypothetical protein